MPSRSFERPLVLGSKKRRTLSKKCCWFDPVPGPL
jgi:hypothetical protein